MEFNFSKVVFAKEPITLLNRGMQLWATCETVGVAKSGIVIILFLIFAEILMNSIEMFGRRCAFETIIRS